MLRSASAWGSAIRTGSRASHRCQIVFVQPAGGRVEGQQRLAGALGVGRVRARVGVHGERVAEAPPVERRRARASAQQTVEGAAEVVAQPAGDGGELGQVAVLEQRVARVGGERAEHVGAQHRHHHRPVAARGLAGHPAVLAAGHGRVALVDERDDLVAQVVQVAAGARRVQELGAAQRGPGVDEHDDRVRAVPGGEHRVEPLDVGGLERGAPDPHVELAGVALEDVDRREPLPARRDRPGER